MAGGLLGRGQARGSWLPGWHRPCLLALAAVSFVFVGPVAFAVPRVHRSPWGRGHPERGRAARPPSRAGQVRAEPPQPAVPAAPPATLLQRLRSAFPALGAAAAASGAALRRLAAHRLRQPAKRAQSPAAEIVFGLALWGAVREAVRAYFTSADSFNLREELFQEMAIARTYRNSVTPWIQTGIITVVFALFVVVGVRLFIKSMKEWEQRQEMKEMSQMGEDALFLMSTPVDATPLEKKKANMRRRLQPWPVRWFGWLLDTLWLFRLGACVGYLLPLLNVLDFGLISISLYPYALGVPPTEPIVNFMMNQMKMQYLHSAYIKSGYYFIIVWFVFIQFAVRNKAAPFFVRFHSSQAILISMLLSVPQQIFFAVLNPYESGLVIQTIMYHSMVAIFLFILGLVMLCCLNALLKKQMKMPLVSEAAVMWAGKE